MTAAAGAEEPWWKTAVVYQTYPRSFSDSDGDGVGDLRGITQRPDHLAELGVGALWLSPVCPSPQDDNGHDISDYRDIDPVFGTLADFDELLARVHERGMRLVMDLMVNHTSDEHPWFTASRDGGADGPMRDRYWWRPARPGTVPGTPGAEPDNWGSVFHHYRRLIDLRRTEPALAFGDFTLLLPDDEQLHAFLRRHEDGSGGATELLVLANLGSKPARVPVPNGWAGTEVLIANHPTAAPFLRPHHSPGPLGGPRPPPHDRHMSAPPR